MRGVWKRPAIVVALACVGWTAMVAVALGAHPVHGALYTGNSGKCAASIREQCVFKFRVSSDGRTLRFVKPGEAISSWQCQGGGGEAIFGSRKYDYRIPSARIRSNGAFSGAGGAGSRRLRIVGSFTGSGKTAMLKFVLPNRCHTPQLTLHEQ
jgi:hypothetical protein